MTFVSWWSGLSRAYQNAYAVIVFDCLLLLGFLVRVRPVQAAWESVTGFLPNIYEGLFIQTIKVIRGISPGSVVIPGVTLDWITLFLSLLTMHLVVGFGLGFLFDHTTRTRVWTFVNFFTLIMVLFVVHFFLIVAAYL